MRGTRLTSEMFVLLSRYSEIPLVHIMKMDTYGLVDQEHALDVVLDGEFFRLYQEKKSYPAYLAEVVAEHYKVSIPRVKKAIRNMKH